MSAISEVGNKYARLTVLNRMNNPFDELNSSRAR